MDSLAAEDPTLPLDLNGSSNVYKLPDISGDGGDLPSAVGDITKNRLLALRARTMKDFEKQITELKKENFNLKLRIYFLEEQIQQKFDGAGEDIYKTNIELKVEVESLKHELQEKQNLLIKASKAVESLAGDKDSKIHRIKEDAQKQIQQIEDFLQSRIHALEEDFKISQAKVETLSKLLEERAQVVDIGHSLISEMHQKDLEVNPALEEKERIIEQLNLVLQSKESLINQLEEQKAQSKLCDGSCAKVKSRKPVDSLQEKDGEAKVLKENQKQLADPEVPLGQVFSELEKAKVTVLSLQERLKEADQTNYDLKNCVLEKEEKLAVQQKNCLKRDKTIQGLTLALKTKEKETEELNHQIEELNLSLSQAREVACKAQIQKFKGVEDCQNILMEKETLLADLHIDNTAKDTEICKLLGVMKKRDQELSDLQQEKERLEKELDEAQQQKSRSDKTINDLRNQLEKLHGEMMEKETALERHYNILLNENKQKFQSQELVIKRLTESLNGKELSLQKLDSAFKEKEVELQQLFNKYLSLQKTKEMLESSNSCTLKEKDDIISHLQQSIVRKSKELEDRKKSEYEELICTLRREQEIYFTLAESVKDSDSISSLQTELNKICSLRKQLEEDVLANRDLRKMLEMQIKAIRNNEDNTFSFCGDQTSYMSICLRDHGHINEETEKLSFQELKKKLSEKVEDAVEKAVNATEKTADQEKESGTQSYQSPVEMEKVIQPDFYQDGRIKDQNEFEEEITRKHFCRQDMNEHERDRMDILKYSDECEILMFGSGWKPLEQENEPRSHVFTTKNECSNENIQDMNEVALRDLVMELRAELKHSQQDNVCNQLPELKTALKMNEETESIKPEMKDAATQISNTEENLKRANSKLENNIFQEEKCWALKAVISHSEEEASKITGHKDALSSDLTLKVNNKSRLPIPSKSYRSFIKQGVLTDLQYQRAECWEELKDCKMQNKELQEKLDISEFVIANLKDNLHVSESVTSDLKEKLQMAESVTKNLKEKLHMAESAVESLKEKFHIAESVIENLKDSSSANRALLTGSGIDTQFNSNNVHSVEKLDGRNSKNVLDNHDELKQRIKDMEIQLEKYQNALLLLPADNRQVPYNDSFNIVLTNFKTSIDVLDTNMKENTDDQAQETNLYSSHATEVKRVELLKQQRMELKYELQKEKETSMKLLDHVYNIQTKIKMSPFRYDSLVQLQARELSFQRQQMKESFSICIMYRQHLMNLIKAFEELLQASDVDYCVAEGFREQLNQSLHMLSTLEEKLQNEELSCGSEVSLLFELNERQKNDIQKMDNTAGHLQENYKNDSPPPSACPSLSDFETSDKSSVESIEDNPDTLKREQEGTTHLSQNLCQDILMEHLQEIRMLRQRLEDSIKTNDRLREQLERQVANAELDQNKQSENEKLRESLSQINFLVEHMHSEYECIKKENETFQQQLCERDEKIRCLTQDIHKSCNELKRLQSEVNSQKHHYEEKQVYQSLQIRQNLYNKLTEEGRRKKDPDTDEEDKNVQNDYVFNIPDNDDSASQCSSSSTVDMSCAPARLVPGHHMWADKNGRHVLGLIEDFDALRKQISEGRKLMRGMDASKEDSQNIKPQASRIKSGDHGLSTSIIRVQQILEEASRLLKLLWRVSLPSSTSHFHQDGDMKSEIAKLKRKLSECERKLYSTVKHLHSTKQLKEDMEKIIIEQLALTHNVLKKARGNLEVQPVEIQH